MTVRWGILGAADIAESSFLPAMREAGGGQAVIVGARDASRAEAFARAHGIDRSVQGYDAVLESPDVDAVYIPLPNSLHADRTIRALEAGKAVLCEKPMCVTTEETAEVLDAARRTGQLLWEAFVFPFNPQTALLRQILDADEVGEIREIDAEFHFELNDSSDIRMNASLGGGALFDLGCYPIRLSRLVFGAEAQRAVAEARIASTGVDDEVWGVLRFEHDRVLRFSCGFDRPDVCFAVLYGSAGEIHLTHPYHPGPEDEVRVVTEDGTRVERPTTDAESFTAAMRHIQAAIAKETEPQHLAVDEAAGNAAAIAMVQGAFRRP